MTAKGVRFRVDFADWCSVGEGKIALLEAIDRCGSMSQAARDLGMSYRRAWLLLRSLKLGFDTPVVVTREGGSNGGGTSLTDFGYELIRAFRDIEAELIALTKERLRVISRRASAARRGRKNSVLDARRERLSRTPDSG